jgi:formylglycine-generating enzyme required for sulfatase activity
VMLGRGENFRVDVTPPPRKAPSGFVYVPPGRFLFGSSEEEGRREMFFAEPQHEVRGAAIWIGKYEVTWGEWLEFLDAMPPVVREQNRPGVEGVALDVAADGTPVLRLAPNGIEHAAALGQPIVYEHRLDHRVQNWARIPVTGISSKQARAYLSWLDSSGRMPGARLCSNREWERAARGADDRSFPSGDVLYPGDANYDETYGRVPENFGPDEVGTHPISDSPFGVSDLAGNVWEYVVSDWDPAVIWVRSGSFYQLRLAVSATNQDMTETDLRNRDIGFRVCASVHRSPS